MYIRTDFHIYEIKSEEIIQGEKYYNIEIQGGLNKLKAEFGKQSENLDELCDEFVYVRNKPSLEKPLTSLIRDISIIDKVRKKSNTTVYGCIWTKWGLKYVAKMDNEGKLVLI